MTSRMLESLFTSGLVLAMVTTGTVLAADPATARSAPPQAVEQPALDPPFALLDANADGRISPGEALGNASEKRFKALDADQDGSVSLDEYSGLSHG